MKNRDYIQDISEIRSMMERSTKFMSLSGWAGILAGMYALGGAWLMVFHFGFSPHSLTYATADLNKVAWVAVTVLILALTTAILFSRRQAAIKNEPLWTITSKRLLIAMAAPLISGGVVVLLLAMQGLNGLLPSATLIFYGLSLVSAAHFTINEIRFMGYMQLALGLAAMARPELSMLLWAMGFGAVHIIYGMYMYMNYERR